MLKKLTTSVSSALDEAAAALNRMKPDQKKVALFCFVKMIDFDKWAILYKFWAQKHLIY